MSRPDPAELPAVSADLLVGMLLAGDARGAQSFVSEQIFDGVGRIEIISRLLGPALARVGQMWLEGAVTVAEEHRATSIVEGLLATTLAEVPTAVSGHRVWLTGVEGEWHTMPARLVAGVWNCLGWDVVALTPSLPADELRSLSQGETTRLAGLSCSLVSNLVPAWQAISVLRECGFRVMVGGRAFDAVPGVAQALGADGHEPDPVIASEILAGWVDAPPLTSRTPVAEDAWTQIEPVWSSLPRLVEEAVTVASELAGVSLSEQVLRQDVSLLARTACAAALAGNPQLLTRHLHWLRELLAASGLDPEIAGSLVWSLERVLPAGGALREVLHSA